jgi:hypothetical protein
MVERTYSIFATVPTSVVVYEVPSQIFFIKIKAHICIYYYPSILYKRPTLSFVEYRKAPFNYGAFQLLVGEQVTKL